MEVEEEHELSTMTSFKGAWYERRKQTSERESDMHGGVFALRCAVRQKSMMAAWQEQVEEDPGRLSESVCLSVSP